MSDAGLGAYTYLLELLSALDEVVAMIQFLVIGRRAGASAWRLLGRRHGPECSGRRSDPTPGTPRGSRCYGAQASLGLSSPPP